MNQMFLTALRLSLHGGLIALAVILLRLVLKKAPKAIHVALWGLVALRLILPFTVEFRFSAVPEVIGTRQVLEEWAEEPLGRYEVFYEGNPEYLQARKDGIQPQRDGAGKRYVTVWENPEAADKTVKEDLIPVLIWVWLTGAAGMLVYMAVSYSRLHKLTLGAFRERENIYRSERIRSPFLLGVVRPRICLPVGLAEPELTYVLAHEQAHIARKDHWWKALGFWILCIHWFNPALWVAYVLFCKDIEFACDAYVAKNLSQEQLADYSQALLNCSLHEKRGLPCPLSFAETGVRERVRKILDYRKPGIWICLAAAAAACFCAVFLMTGSGQTWPEAGNAQTAPTVPTSPPPTGQTVKEDPVWMAKVSYPSYNEFFEENRRYLVDENPCSWRMVRNGRVITYELVIDRNAGHYNHLQNKSISIIGSNGEMYESVFFSDRFQNATLLSCDGRTAYFSERWSDEGKLPCTRIVRLDLKTWEFTVLAEADGIGQIHVRENAVMYYMANRGSRMSVCMLYLPEGLELEFFQVEQGYLLVPPEWTRSAPEVD